MKKFKTIEDLYKTVFPALKSRKEDLHREKYVMVTEDDIWNYLVETNWIDSENLELSTIIDDILNVDGYKVSQYVKDKMNSKERYLYFKGNEE
ncbi:MAG: hypothetical protein IJO32_01115 [Bacilli bacterium]|nr:hypothetical protein [Bacilli bacterium]